MVIARDRKEGFDYEKAPQGVKDYGERCNVNYDWLLGYCGELLERGRSVINILEVGCGGGRNLEVIYRRFGNAVSLNGIDISAASIDYAKRRGFGEFHVMSADSMSLGRRYDLIIVVDVLEHLPSRAAVERCIMGAREHLNERGRIYLSVPIELNRYCLTWLFDKCHSMRGLTNTLFGHSLQFDSDDVMAMVTRETLWIEEVFYSVHWLAQIQMLLFYYLPKVILRNVFSERTVVEMRDSNEEMGGGEHATLRWFKRVWVATGYPLMYIAYLESRKRAGSPIGAGNMHLVLSVPPRES